MEAARERKAVLVFAAMLPLLALLGLPLMFGDVLSGPWGEFVVLAYVVGICPAIFTGLVWRRLLRGGWCRLSRLAGVAAAHPLGAALFFFAPVLLVDPDIGIRLWLRCAPVLVGTALLVGLAVEFVWPRAACRSRASLAVSGRLPT